jgi:hypothetical protein
MTVRRFLLILILVVTGGVSVYAASTTSFFGTSADSMESMVREIEACTGEPDAIECARPIIRRVVTSYDTAAFLNSLAVELPAIQCHYMGHVLGQELYRARTSVERVLGECSRICQGACVHGALGEAFTEALQSEIEIDPAHLNIEEIRTIGEKLCTTRNTCHGVGHALYQQLGEFEPALSVCTDIAPPNLTVHCYRGAFMEYTDALASRSVLTDAPSKSLSVEELDTLCVRGSLDESRACFMYLPKMIEITYAEGGEQVDAFAHVRDLCTALPSQERYVCVMGMGAYRSFQLFSEPETVRGMCNRFVAPIDRAACVAGVVSVAAEHEEKMEETFAFCRSFPDDAVSEACYGSIFAAFDVGGNFDARTLCKDARCLRAAEQDAE